MDISRTKQLIVIILGILIFFIGILLPLFANIPGLYSYYQTTKYLSLLSATVLGIFILAISSAQFSVSHSIFRYKNLLLFLGISFVLSVIFSQSPIDSIIGQYSIWEFNALTFICYSIITLSLSIWLEILRLSDLQKTIIQVTLILTSLSTIIYSLGEYYFWHPQTGYVSEGIQRISLGFRNPLYAGFFISLIVIFTFVQFVGNVTKSIPNKKVTPFPFLIILYFLIFSLSTHALILTFTRTSYISTLISILIITVALFIHFRKQKLVLIRLSITVLLCAITTFLSLLLLRNQLLSRNEDIFSDSAQTTASIAGAAGNASITSFFSEAQNYSSWYIRLKEWEWGFQTITGSAKTMLFGTGGDAAYLILPEFRDPLFNAFPTDSLTRPNSVRNLYITVILMYGIPFMVAIGISIFIGIRSLLIKIFASNESTLSLSLFTIIIGFLLNSIFYLPLFPIITFMLFITAILINNHYRETLKISFPKKNRISFLPLLFLPIIIIWMGIITYSEYRLDQISLYWQPTKEVMGTSYNIAVNTSVFKRIYTYYFPQDPVSISFLNEFSQSQNLDDLRIAAAIAYQKGREENNNEYVNKSINLLESMIKKDPSAPVHRDELGLRYLYLKDYAKSQIKFEKAIELKKDYWFAYLHMGELLRQTCKPKEAIEWYEKARSLPQALDEIAEARLEVEKPVEGCR